MAAILSWPQLVNGCVSFIVVIPLWVRQHFIMRWAAGVIFPVVADMIVSLHQLYVSNKRLETFFLIFCQRVFAV